MVLDSKMKLLVTTSATVVLPLDLPVVMTAQEVVLAGLHLQLVTDTPTTVARPKMIVVLPRMMVLSTQAPTSS